MKIIDLAHEIEDMRRHGHPAALIILRPAQLIALTADQDFVPGDRWANRICDVPFETREGWQGPTILDDEQFSALMRAERSYAATATRKSLASPAMAGSLSPCDTDSDKSPPAANEGDPRR